jgi:hypothetical protein
MAEMSGTAVALTRLSLRRVFAGRRRRAGRRRGRRADETLLEVPEATAALHVHRDRGVKRDGRRASCRDCDRAATRTQKGPAKGVRSEQGEVARPPAFLAGRRAGVAGELQLRGSRREVPAQTRHRLPRPGPSRGPGSPAAGASRLFITSSCAAPTPKKRRCGEASARYVPRSSQDDLACVRS